MTTEIETYLNSLSENILTIDIRNKGIQSLPKLTRFKNLQHLNCSNNQLTSLPILPQSLQELYCSNNQLTLLPTLPQNLQILYCNFNNKLTSLPTLPQNLQILHCSDNQLTLLPTLPQNLQILHCSNNQLASLPILPPNLQHLFCSNNQLTSLPILPPNLQHLFCSNNQLTSLPILPPKLRGFCVFHNPIDEIIVGSNSWNQFKQNIIILHNFRHLYFCLKLKKKFRKWLWEKVREPKAMKIYSPNYLVENLKETDDLDTFLHNWK